MVDGRLKHLDADINYSGNCQDSNQVGETPYAVGETYRHSRGSMIIFLVTQKIWSFVHCVPPVLKQVTKYHKKPICKVTGTL